MVLVGNKLDREEFEEREVSTETGETFAKVRIMGWENSTSLLCTPLPSTSGDDRVPIFKFQIYDAQFIEASAKTGYNVGNSLLLLVR